MQIAEEGNEAAVFGARKQHIGTLGFRNGELRLHGIAVFIARAEILAIDLEGIRVLACQYRVGLGSGGDEDRMRGQAVITFALPLAVFA